MTRRRWIADRVSGNQATLTGDHARHLVRVLRARLGQEFDIVAGAVVRRGRIVNIADDRVDFALGEEVAAGSSPPRVSLWLAIFKFDRMEWVIEKATELGVSTIIPVIARRTGTHLASASPKRADRWKRIALEASEQSRRAAPPEIAAPVHLSQAVNSAPALKIVLSESESQTQLRDAVREHKPEQGVQLAVGPEGGWTEDEIELFQKQGWLSASLGPTVLRAETAAIAAIAITFSELG
jgi:16S rRNA (uracil1498-N3)-methyltransferase